MSATLDILSLSPCSAGARRWRSARHGDAHVIVCKRSYALEAGEVSLATEQAPLTHADVHSPLGALLAPSDFAPRKRQVDVLLTGRAYAPVGSSASRLTCHFVMGELEKSFEVRAERYVDLDGVLRDEARFTAASLGWDQAAGGPDTLNPVGMGWRRDERGRLHLARLQPVAFEPAGPSWHIPTVGLGPIAASWPDRSQRAGRRGPGSVEALLQEGLPDDFDLDFFQVAPFDQRLPRVDRDATITLENLHPAAGRVVVKLAGDAARCVVEPSGREIDMVLDTLAIDTESLVLTLTWRGTLFEREAPDARSARVLVEPRGQRTSVPEVLASAPLEAAAGRDARASQPSALPFVGHPPSSPGVPPGAPPSARPPPSGLAGTPFMRLGGEAEEPNPSRRRPRNTLAMKVTQPEDASPAFLRHGSRGAVGAGEPTPGAPPPEGLRPPTMATPPALVQQPAPTPAQADGSPPPPRAPSFGPPAVALPASVPAAPAAVLSPPAPLLTPGFAPQPSIPLPSALPALDTAELAARARPPSYLLGASPQAPAQVPSHTADSARAGVGAASDAAAREAQPSERASRTRTAASEPERAPRPPGFLDLLWFQSDAHERLRASPRWAKLVRRPPNEADWLDAKSGDGRTKEPPQRVVARALARGEPLGVGGVAQAVLDAVDEDGVLVRPLVVVEGEVQLAFDPRETLLATLSFAEPLAAGDRKVKEATDAASELLKSERKVTLPMLESATLRVRQAFAGSSNRGFPPGYLEATVERWLLDERRFQRRVVLGDARLVSYLTPSGSSQGLPLYLPAELEQVVPTLPRFKVRVLAEPHARQEASEQESTTLLALAFARVAGR